MWREMIIFADRQTIKQTHTNSKTEAHSYPLWIVGERANITINNTKYSIPFILGSMPPSPVFLSPAFLTFHPPRNRSPILLFHYSPHFYACLHSSFCGS